MVFKGEQLKPWVLKKIVLPQHTDHAGVMWHGSYFNWLEEGRINALSKVGLSYAELSKQGLEIPVFHLQIKYISPLYHGDEVLMESRVLTKKGIRWPWKTIFLKDQNQLSAEANIELVLVKRDQKGIRLLRNYPQKIEVAFSNLQKGSS
ncbi:acyl-CoA thioesterase [Prochlorococcus marinus]|uniref:Predicted thioesterase n=1 Tax=Prochlorococcus marinus (strain MIT 9211) TaxID=93059 RepID=A9BDX3_PROM4|nr:acyl-CoA thioesterase [Prochlorococcus marinus]ABX08283.1 Predicted thioesterase [Prochlorococcus marinus str. MIT 9211]